MNDLIPKPGPAATPEVIRKDCPECGAPLESYMNDYGRMIVDGTECNHIEVNDPEDQARRLREQIRQDQERFLFSILYGGGFTFDGERMRYFYDGTFPVCSRCGRRHP